MAVLRCERMSDTLAAVLAAPPPPADANAGTEAAALHAARLAAARLLRVLAQSSPAAARAARSLGESALLSMHINMH